MKKPSSYTAVGKNAHRVDGIEKVTGKAVYAGDIELPGMAYAKILRSPMAHAKLVKVDASKAANLTGVVAVLTRDDIKDLNYRYGATYKDQCIVAVDKVRYVGDPVAAVLADDPARAEEALDLIDVEYEELPKVTGIDDAIAPGAPLVHEGDVARATLRDHLSGIFRLPLSRIRVIVPYVGGGYGGKLYVKCEPIAAALSWKTRRPVKLVLSIGESFKTVTRHAARVTLKTGIMRDGRLFARECQIFTDTGAYADAGPRVTQKAGYRSLGPYRIPHAKIEAHSVYTNTVPAGAFRGFGGVQVTWAYESQMDMMAERLGIDPVNLRLQNRVRKGEIYTSGDTPVDCDLKEGLWTVADALKWRQKC